MKKIMLLLFLLLSAMVTVYAEEKLIPTYEVTTSYNKKKGGIRHSPARKQLPLVKQDGCDFEISQLPDGNCIAVEFRTTDDECIYSVSDIATSAFKLTVPLSVIEETSKIIITIDGIVYLGVL